MGMGKWKTGNGDENGEWDGKPGIGNRSRKWELGIELGMGMEMGTGIGMENWEWELGMGNGEPIQ